MNTFRLAVFGAAILFTGVALAAPSLAPGQKATICGKRMTCVVTGIQAAGKDTSGSPMSVAEIHFGLKDKPDDAPDDGCIVSDDSDKKDGGTEYWLLGAKPTQLLALCNDGYGAAGLGEDTVSFGNNRMTRDQSGGSSWRWSIATVYTLSPFRAISTDGCSYHDTGPETGTESHTDEVKFRAVEIAKNPSAKYGDDDDMGCPDTTPAMFARPKPFPAPKTVTALPVPAPANAALFGPVPDGTTLGACASVISTDGKNGFVMFGQAAGAKAAEVRVLAMGDGNILLAQIYDPTAAKSLPGKSWIGGSHLEVWAGGVSTDGPLKRSDLSQVAVDLDGTVRAVGKAAAPTVRRWQAKDERGRPVTDLLLTWTDDAAFVGAVSYSQSDNGKQVRLVSNAPMVRGVPVYIPDVVTMQSKCAIRNARIVIQ